MTDKELQQLFKSKLRHREFPINAHNWQAMEGMLNQRRRRKAFYTRMSTAMVTFGVGVALLLLVKPPWSSFTSGSGLPPLSDTLSRNAPFATKPFGKFDSSSSIHGPVPGSGLSSFTVPYLPGAQPAVNRLQKPLPMSAAHKGNKALNQKSSTSPIASGEPVKSANSGDNTVSGLSRNYNSSPDSPATLISQPHSPSGGSDEPINLPLKAWQLRPVLPSHYVEMEQKRAMLQQLARGQYVPSPWRLSAGITLGANNGAAGVVGANAQVDVQISYAWHPAWELYAGIGMAHYANLNINTRHDSVFFGFGREDVRVKTAYQKINTLEFPLGLRYQWRQNRVAVGAYAQKVLGVQKQVQRQVFSFKGRDFIERQNTFEQVDQINTWQYGFSAGYQRQLSNRWQVGIQAGFNLSDLTNNQYEQLQQTFRLNRVGVGLRYNFTP